MIKENKMEIVLATRESRSGYRIPLDSLILRDGAVIRRTVCCGGSFDSGVVNCGRNPHIYTEAEVTFSDVPGILKEIPKFESSDGKNGNIA